MSPPREFRCKLEDVQGGGYVWFSRITSPSTPDRLQAAHIQTPSSPPLQPVEPPRRLQRVVSQEDVDRAVQNSFETLLSKLQLGNPPNNSPQVHNNMAMQDNPFSAGLPGHLAPPGPQQLYTDATMTQHGRSHYSEQNPQYPIQNLPQALSRISELEMEMVEMRNQMNTLQRRNQELEEIVFSPLHPDPDYFLES